LTRQALPAVERSPQQLEDMARGAYIVVEPENDVQAIIMASGSEVALALDAAGALNAEGACVRVISIPSVDTFEKQTHNYRASLLPDRVRRRVAIEAGSDVYWRQYVGIDGCVIGLSDFGASAPAAKLFERFELTSAQVTARIRQYLGAQIS
jgi:transketolase